MEAGRCLPRRGHIDCSQPRTGACCRDVWGGGARCTARGTAGQPESSLTRHRPRHVCRLVAPLLSWHCHDNATCHEGAPGAVATQPPHLRPAVRWRGCCWSWLPQLGSRGA
eukprot:6600847-Alexandrium_andersonii.AAC.1